MTNAGTKTSTDLRYEISDSSPQYLPVRTFNSTNPLGYTTPLWMSNINPQQDSYTHPFYDGQKYPTRFIAAESDMIRLQYEDDSKIGYYGSGAKNKNNIWYLDVFHDEKQYPTAKWYDEATGTYKTEPVTENIDSSFKPNTILPALYDTNNTPDVTNYDIAASLGNYGVESTYDITFTNTGSEDKVIEFRNLNWQNLVICATDNQTGETIMRYTGYGERDEIEFSKHDRLVYSMTVPKGQTVSYTVSITLVTADPGGMKYYFKVIN